MKSFGLVLMCLLVFSSGNVYANIGDENGNDWINWNAGHRIIFVNGFISGSGYTIKSNNYKLENKFLEQNNLKVESLTKKAVSEKNKVCLDVIDLFSYRMYHAQIGEYDKIDELNRFLIVNISVQTVVDGLVSFYNDFKNRNIKLSDAIYVIKKQVNGEDSDDIERIILFLRNGKSMDAVQKYMMKLPSFPLSGVIPFP